MSNRQTSTATPTSTSSRASAAGRSHSAGLDGPMTGPSGPGVVPVSRFRSLDSDKAMPTNATFGPLFSASSPSAALQWCLESRLRQNLDVNGSLEYELTWKQWDMPAGVPICRLRALARRISDNGCSGWPTPMVPNGDRSLASAKRIGHSYYNSRGKKAQFGLEHAARLTGWPTPMAGTPKQKGYNEAGNTDSGRKTCALVTGTTTDSSSARTEDRGVLAPAFSRWIMGFPEGWESYADSATPSCLK